MKTPVQKNYFGVRHGKSSCDACTGRVKQGVTRLAKSEQEVVNNAQSFYDACVKHLQISPTNDDKCQHYMITFHFQKQLGKRPKTDSLIGIPETCKLHQIGNMEEMCLISVNLCAAALGACMAQKNVKIMFVLQNGQDMTCQLRKLSVPI